MKFNASIMEHKSFWCQKQLQLLVACVVLWTVFFCGCSITPVDRDLKSGKLQRKTFFLKLITAGQSITFLSDIDLGTISYLPESNALLVRATPDKLRKTGIILDIVDTDVRYVVKKIATASSVRNMPSNDQIAEAIGSITIGTFTSPPESGEYERAIIDLHGETVLAIVPEHFWPDILAIVKSGTKSIEQSKEKNDQQNQHNKEVVQVDDEEQSIVTNGQDKSPVPIAGSEKESSVLSLNELLPQFSKQTVPDIKATSPNEPELETALAEEKVQTQESQVVSRNISESSQSSPFNAQQDPNITRGFLIPSRKISKASVARSTSPLVSFPNGDDVIELSLPEKIDIIHLIDLVGEYLNLDCVYEEEKIRDQVITLKLHSKLRSELKVKELYSLLETVLKFKGYAMTRQEGNLVTIVPADDVLTVDPELVDPNSWKLEVGDVVVTRLFEMHYLDVTSVSNLLQNMKLGVAVSPIEETQSIFITCYAHRMRRIEQLLDIVDKPGRSKKFLFRPLRYTMAKTLANKIETIVKELKTIPVKIDSTQEVQLEPSLRISTSLQQQPSRTAGLHSYSRQVVYLDADERTNRILIVGFEEQVATIEELIDALDVAEQDLRTLEIYNIRYVDAEEIKRTLEELEIIGNAVKTSGGVSRATLISSPSLLTETDATGMTGGALVEEPQVVVLTTTNSLLINATKEQHSQINTIIRYADMIPEDQRTLRTYHIGHIKAEEVKKKLEELGISGKAIHSLSISPTTPTSESTSQTETETVNTTEEASVEDIQVVELKANNSLLINATEEQHSHISSIINHIDVKTLEQAIPYEVYFLENQTPQNLVGVLEKIVKETIKDDDGKIEKIIENKEDQIMIVPDEATFSIIVYGNKKNQEWISKLIKTLDKRRPQVLIDATLVEIRKTDEFDYDLNLISSFPDLAETGGQTDSFQVSEEQTAVEKLLEPGMRDRFIDFQVNAGAGTGFYADMHVNALLKAMQTKNYGRVLAKPKVLVNDNETGIIQTVDTTFVEKRTSIPVVSGSAGEQNTLIETATDFEQYDAGITLEITPHISEGDLLRLEISLSRSDFGTITGTRPPDLTSSDVNTVVTVPDGSTIILGGMLKLNQSKGGAKVPLLGDLPLIGLIFRSVERSDIQSKLYVFVRAEIIRPSEALAGAHKELERISQQNREAFEKHEEEFQNYQEVPGTEPETIKPAKALEAL